MTAPNWGNRASRLSALPACRRNFRSALRLLRRIVSTAARLHRVSARICSVRPVKSNVPGRLVRHGDFQRLEPLMAITKYSVDDYDEMIRLGVLTERDRVELIRGEIVAKMAIGPRHSTCVKGLNLLLTQRVAGRAIAGVQDPVRLPDSEPEPDISLLRPPKERYLTGHPQPTDIFLIVEVADSSLDDDPNIMRPLYAESGIQEFWIVNLRDECLEVYRGPQPDGTYREVRILQRGQSTDIAALPGVVVAVDEVL